MPEVDERYSDTVRRLAGAQKSGKGAPAYSRFVNRRLGRYLAAAAYHVGLTPNTVTLLSAACSFTAIALLALLRPSLAAGVLTAALLVLGYGLDAADGQLARLRGGGSVAGEWLDHFIDAIKVASYHLAVAIGAYRSGLTPDGFLLVPLGYSVVASVSFFAQILNEQLSKAHGGARSTADPAEPAPLLASLLKIPTDYGLLCLLPVLLAWYDAFLVAYTAMFVVSAAYLALASVSWFRRMRALDGT